MEYLYALQNFREAAPGFVTYFFLFISEFFLVACPVFAAVVYWSINKKEGALMLIGYSGARYVNQTVKNIACVYRPWILDSRLHVERHAAKTATGYSFPSGHTTTATAVFGQTAIYQKSRKWLVACCAVFILLVAFSRNFLGAHTLQDVLVAIAETMVVLTAANFVRKMVDEKPASDTLVAVVMVAISSLIFLFLVFKKYPVDYDAEGKILVEPFKMKTGCFSAYGMFVGAVSAWWLERHFVKFSTDVSVKEKIIRSVAGVVIFLVMNYTLAPVLKCLGTQAEHLAKNFLLMFVIIYVYPLIFNSVSNRLKK